MELTTKAGECLYLLGARALPGLSEQLDGGGVLGRGAVVLALLLRVVLRRAGDGFLAGGRRGTGRRLPLQHCLLLATLVPGRTHVYTHARTRKDTHTHAHTHIIIKYCSIQLEHNQRHSFCFCSLKNTKSMLKENNNIVVTALFFCIAIC